MYTLTNVVRSVLPEAYRLPYETENSKIIEELIQKLDEQYLIRNYGIIQV